MQTCCQGKVPLLISNKKCYPFAFQWFIIRFFIMLINSGDITWSMSLNLYSEKIIYWRYKVIKVFWYMTHTSSLFAIYTQCWCEQFEKSVFALNCCALITSPQRVCLHCCRCQQVLCLLQVSPIRTSILLFTVTWRTNWVDSWMGLPQKSPRKIYFNDFGRDNFFLCKSNFCLIF